MYRPGRGFLNAPGPTNIPERVIRAMSRQAIDLVDEELEDAVRRCFTGLRPILGLEGGAVYLYSANGHGAWEAAIANVLAPGDLVLVPQTGQFSAGWVETAEGNGVVCEILPHDIRTSFPMDKLAARLAADKQHKVKAVMLVHTDTSTGVTHDPLAARAALDACNHPALLMLDAVATLGTTKVDMKGWNIDVCLSASQKGLMGPPGMAVVAANDKALEVHRQTKRDRLYWDWTLRGEGPGYRSFCGTVPEHHIFALDEALNLIAEETLPAIFARHHAISRAVHVAVETWGKAGQLEINALNPAERAVGVTAVRVAAGIDPDLIRSTARRMFRTSVAGGLGDIRHSAFRIGHLGDMNAPMILGALSGVQMALSHLGIPHGKGALDAAAEYLAEAAAEAAPALAAAQ